jgi:5-deoxy-glucuronate isomerase
MNWFFKKGDLSQDGWDVLVDSSIEGWQHTGLKVGTLREGHSFHIQADGVERIIFPLEGRGLTVEYREAGEPDFKSQFLNGRESVFHGTADLVYVPLDTEVKIWGDGRVAIGEALAKNVKPVRYIKAEEVPVLVRGAGRESRQIHNFGVPETLDAPATLVEPEVPDVPEDARALPSPPAGYPYL